MTLSGESFGADSCHSRDALATRDVILRSARKAWVRAGYDGAGVGEIAEGAGVTAMMVNRYFGSKKLFIEVDQTMKSPTIVVRLVALFSPEMRTLLPLLGKVRNATSAKAKRVLKWSPRSPEDAVVATAESLIALKVVAYVVGLLSGTISKRLPCEPYSVERNHRTTLECAAPIGRAADGANHLVGGWLLVRT